MCQIPYVTVRQVVLDKIVLTAYTGSILKLSSFGELFVRRNVNIPHDDAYAKFGKNWPSGSKEIVKTYLPYSYLWKIRKQVERQLTRTTVIIDLLIRRAKSFLLCVCLREM